MKHQTIPKVRVILPMRTSVFIQPARLANVVVHSQRDNRQLPFPSQRALLHFRRSDRLADDAERRSVADEEGR